MDDDDDIPVAIISKPKLKSFGFANSLSSVFNFGTLKEIHLNAKKAIIDENVIQKSPQKEDAKTNKEIEFKKSEKIISPINQNKFPVDKVAEVKTHEKSSSLISNNNITENVNKPILNENNKRLREQETEEERDLKRPNFSQVDYKDKKKSFSNDNFRRLNMKTFRSKGQPGKFNQKGAKFKRFKWKKNQIKNGTNAKYGIGVKNNDDDDKFNYNLINDSPIKEEELQQAKEEIDELSAEAIFAKLRKPTETKDKTPIKKAILKKKEAEPKKEKPKKKDVEGAKKKITKIDKKEISIMDSPIKKITEKEKHKITTDILPLSDLDESEKKLSEEVHLNKKSKKNSKKVKIDSESEIDDEEDKPANPEELKVPEPLFQLNEDGSLPKLPKYVFKILEKDFGHKCFKPHQEEAVTRIACGLSTVVVLSTGYGKSLIYQLAAKLYARSYPGSLVLVVSPLISLMQDQLHNLSRSLKAAVCDSQMDDKEYQTLLSDLANGKINILFMSPEAIINKKIRYLPRLAFVCIDEVHCLSQWSHNFRPSYLQLGQMLLEQYKVTCILGLTATATCATINEIKSYFAIDHNSILKDCDLPENLLLTATRDNNKDRALIELITSEVFKPFFDHVIIYCSRREQTEKIAQLLRLSLKTNYKGYDYDELAKMERKQPKGLTSKSKSAKISKDEDSEANIAEAYHAGLTSHQRKRIQNQFIKGKLKIIVSTCAFGMGINMPNIRSVIHYNMPKAIENYVQEIGRAGRDGLMSRCHVFLETQREDINETKKYIHMNGYDQKTIKRLLLKIFNFCCNENEHICAGVKDDLNHNVALPIAEMVEYLDIKEETILTLLCYLESANYVKILSNCYKMCSIKSYKGLNNLNAMSKQNPFIAAIFKQKFKQDNITEIEKNLNNNTDLEIDIIQLCEDLKEEYDVVRQKLRKLEWNIDDVGNFKGKSGINVQFETVSFRVKRKCISSENELDNVNDFLWNRVNSHMNSSYANFKALYKILSNNSFRTVGECIECSHDIINKDEVDVNCEEDKIDKQENKNPFDTDDLKNLDKSASLSKNQENSQIDRITFNSRSLKQKFNDYFNNKLDIDDFTRNYEFNFKNNNLENDSDINRLITDIKRFIYTYSHEVKLNGIIIARIFHGISSPKFPAEVWGRNRNFWRSHLDFDFETIIKYATEQLINA